MEVTARLLSISRVHAQEYEYEVRLEFGDEQRAMRCRVAEHAGIRVVQPEPDFMAELTFSPRLLAAAVLAFDEVARADQA